MSIQTMLLIKQFCREGNFAAIEAIANSEIKQLCREGNLAAIEKAANAVVIPFLECHHHRMGHK